MHLSYHILTLSYSYGEATHYLYRVPCRPNAEVHDDNYCRHVDLDEIPLPSSDITARSMRLAFG